MTVAEILARFGAATFLLGLMWAGGGVVLGRHDIAIAALCASSMGFLTSSIASGFVDGDGEETGESLTEWEGQ